LFFGADHRINCYIFLPLRLGGLAFVAPSIVAEPIGGVGLREGCSPVELEPKHHSGFEKLEQHSEIRGLGWRRAQFRNSAVSDGRNPTEKPIDENRNPVQRDRSGGLDGPSDDWVVDAQSNTLGLCSPGLRPALLSACLLLLDRRGMSSGLFSLCFGSGLLCLASLSLGVHHNGAFQL
jgi:hypothetical protein